MCQCIERSFCYITFKLKASKNKIYALKARVAITSFQFNSFSTFGQVYALINVVEKFIVAFYAVLKPKGFSFIEIFSLQTSSRPPRNVHRICFSNSYRASRCKQCQIKGRTTNIERITFERKFSKRTTRLRRYRKSVSDQTLSYCCGTYLLCFKVLGTELGWPSRLYFIFANSTNSRRFQLVLILQQQFVNNPLSKHHFFDPIFAWL